MKIDHIRNTKDIVSVYINRYVNLDNTCLDATVGNGNDICRLGKLVGKNGKVYGFDIQEIAIENTKNLLEKQDVLNRVKLITDSHENIDYYIKEKLNFVIYNLGYLPKGDKSIKTNEKSTIISIGKALNLMDNNSLMLITTYIGHLGGKSENDAVNKFLSSLNQREFNVIKYEFINQRNNPPMVYVVEKL